MKQLMFYSLAMLCCMISYSQTTPSRLPSESWQTLVYQIDAKLMSQILHQDSVDIQNLLQRSPNAVIPKDSFKADDYGIGNYVLLSVVREYIIATCINISKLQVLPINNRNKLQLDIQRQDMLPVQDPSLLVNWKPVPINKASNTFFVKANGKNDLLVQATVPGDTLFVTLSPKDDYNVPSMRKQYWQRIATSRIFRWFSWLPLQVNNLFKGKPKYAKYQSKLTGLAVFNQPAYKPGDTVKYKVNLLSKKGKLYKKKVLVYLSYSNYGENVLQLLTTLQPTAPSAYNGQLVIADTIPMDTQCSLLFKTSQSELLYTARFRTEDYLLNQMGTLTCRSAQNTYRVGDSLVFFAAAKDANGLPVLDGSVKLLLLAEQASIETVESVFVKDTLYEKEWLLDGENDTKMVVPAKVLPSATFKMTAHFRFKNTNNELQEKSLPVSYQQPNTELLVAERGDSLQVDYVEFGNKTSAAGWQVLPNKIRKSIHFPCGIKIDPTINSYTFEKGTVGSRDFLQLTHQLESNYLVDLAYNNRLDTMGFTLNNPNKILVYYSVFDGNRLLAADKSAEGLISWSKQQKLATKAYRVRWQYYWRGEEKTQEANIGLLYKNLTVKISGQTAVFPGQQDTLSIQVTDYKNRPAAHVNLTAVSYNNQFGNKIMLPRLPNLSKYHIKTTFTKTAYEWTDDSQEIYQKTYSQRLGQVPAARQQFHLDSIAYYRLLFPNNGYQDEAISLQNWLPQVAVHVVQSGQSQEIYLLYLNRRMVFYNGINTTTPYSFEVIPGYVQLGIRLKDRYIEVDSIYIQPSYKHDISFDLNHLPPHTKVTPMPLYWESYERSQIEQSIFKMDGLNLGERVWLWQSDRVFNTTVGHGQTKLIAGPFDRDSIHFFNPSSFAINFPFEPGYQYRLFPHQVRLERQSLFNTQQPNVFLRPEGRYQFKLFDTIAPPPTLQFTLPKPALILPVDFNREHESYASSINGKFNVLALIPKDTILQYLVLLKKTNSKSELLVLRGWRSSDLFKNIDTGFYQLFLVTENKSVAQIICNNTQVNGTMALRFFPQDFCSTNHLFDSIVSVLQNPIEEMPPVPPVVAPIKIKIDSSIYVQSGGVSIKGQVIDARGKFPVASATVEIEKYHWYTRTNEKGYFELPNLAVGKYEISVKSIGYLVYQRSVDLIAGSMPIMISLSVNKQSLSEVVVVGYGSRSKKDLTGSVSIVSELSGKVSGLNIINNQGVFGVSNRISLRGIQSFSADNAPLIVVDGVIYKSMPPNLSSEMIKEITILKGNEAVAIYGAYAANGAVVISTISKTQRNNFKDYALWQPNIFTDKNGKANIGIQYPDNVTGWQTIIAGLDKKARVGAGSFFTQSFKPLQATLSVPGFLIDGDQVSAIGSIKNYTNDVYQVQSSFTVAGKIAPAKAHQLSASSSQKATTTVEANSIDTLAVQFGMESSTGFKDAEERKIPVYKKGTLANKGSFWVLNKDTTVQFEMQPAMDSWTLYAQNNTLDLLLDEVNHLDAYPQFCMEQTASKALGFAMEKQIKQQLGAPFMHQEVMDQLLFKLQKAQQFDGGWAWWEAGPSNFYISNYVAAALLSFREKPLMEQSVRNAFLFLQSQLGKLNKNELLTALLTLSKGKHLMNYSDWISQISFDSLPIHQQWQWVEICQQQTLPYQPQLKYLLARAIKGVLGELHWGANNYKWYSNEVATTVIAFRVLQQEKQYEQQCDAMIQYFLSRRTGGYWTNTVESASISQAILPAILQRESNFTQPAQLQITGDTSFLINQFPFRLQSKSNNIKQLNITKSGGGLLYCTAYQTYFNPNPVPVTDLFSVDRYFSFNGARVADLKEGEQVTMVVTVNCSKDAEFVAIEIPIPAGCTYADKSTLHRNEYRSFYKDKVMIFSEKLSQGLHRFEIPLTTRFAGSFNLNPAKVELMYYPTFYGQTAIEKVTIGSGSKSF